LRLCRRSCGAAGCLDLRALALRALALRALALRALVARMPVRARSMATDRKDQGIGEGADGDLVGHAEVGRAGC